MKRHAILILALAFAATARADIHTTVCLADGSTPLELLDPCIPNVYRPIMVGTRLTITVNSDADGVWDGALYVYDPYRVLGQLFGRDLNETTEDYEGSHLEAASPYARVYLWEDDEKSGFELYGDSEAVAGDWFIIDYNAMAIGDCNVWFYDYDYSWEEPIYDFSFAHVPTRDWNDDSSVNLADFSLLALNWRREDCLDPDWCMGADLDFSGQVDWIDAAYLAEYWLERTR